MFRLYSLRLACMLGSFTVEYNGCNGHIVKGLAKIAPSRSYSPYVSFIYLGVIKI